MAEGVDRHGRPTCDQHGRVRARLLDPVPRGSGKVYAHWLAERGEAFRAAVHVAATPGPVPRRQERIDDQPAVAVAVLEPSTS
jgi:transposase